MLKVMTLSNPQDARTRIEVWLENVYQGSGPPSRHLHAVSFREQQELARRELSLRNDDSLSGMARRMCRDFSFQLGWFAGAARTD